jgi:hypothetical protein
MRTRKAPRYGLRPAARFACAAALCLATGATAQVTSPKRDAPKGPPTSGSVVSYQEAPSGGIIYLEQKGGIVSAVAPPVKPAGGTVAAAPAKAPPVATAAAPKAASSVARKAPATPSKVAQGPASPDRARP